MTLLDLRDHLTTLIETGRLHPITVIDPVKRPVTDVFPSVGLAFGGK